MCYENRRISFGNVLLFVALFFPISCVYSLCQAEDVSTSVAEIAKVWGEHTNSIDSFMYECEIKESHAVYVKSGAPDPFDDKSVGNSFGSQNVTKRMVYKVEKDKLYRHVVGDAWDSSTNLALPHEWKFTLIGNDIRKFVHNKNLPFGHGAIGNKNNSGRLKKHVFNFDSSPIMLWYDPIEFLTQLSLTLEQLKVLETVFSIEKGECYKIVSINKKRNLALLVQNEAPYLPVQFTSFRSNGNIGIDFNLTYKKHEDGTEIVESWTIKIYSGKQIVKNERHGLVKTFSKNHDYEEEDFEFTFPIGTYVIQHTDNGKRYQIQSTNEEMLPITEEEYGKLNLSKNR